ncbi:MAG TPA: methylated-DNA--[protein]-cysteine S-methyltransferase [bacterium]|jgi:AraC family transcriptional regulator of adaptative response/methylated-DNA-[protein]-cysteine methyltransferase|nr:methylated-DNA--[protein]-cysteine S-methyltransferase [bacterium]
MSDYDRIEKTIHYLDKHFQEQPSLEKIAQSIHLSPFHFQRLFRKWAGVSPKQFIQYLTAQHAKQRLLESRSVLEASYDSGLSGPGRLHDLMVTVEAMTPGEVKVRGKGMKIEWGIHPTPFGNALIAVTARGICGLSFLENKNRKAALVQMRRRWLKAEWRENHESTLKMIRHIFEKRSTKTNLKVLLAGTAFQIKVWEALLKIPTGLVQSYQDVAKTIRKPRASRAVGTAVGQNSVAYLIPCHRVIRETGILGEYRWGSSRKKAMLGWEESKRF